MTFLTAKSLPRRTVLRGLGATLALPLLDAMTPRSRCARAAATPVHRFQAFYVPNGMAMEYWSPKGEGAAFELSPILEPLAPFRNQMLVLSGHQGELELHPRRRVRDRSSPARRAAGGTRSRSSPTSRWTSCSRGISPSETQVGVARAGDGRPEQRRRLHRQPELRLHAHDLVAQPDAAAADGVQPARGVREAVRRQRQHRARPRAKRGCASTRASSIR